jgi:hypothetical protein
LVLAMLVIFLAPISVNAAIPSTASPLGLICPTCGGNVVTSTTWSNDWVVYKQITCTHYVYGTDLIWKRTGVKTTVCSNCGTGSSSTTTQTKTECHGYNK